MFPRSTEPPFSLPVRHSPVRQRPGRLTARHLLASGTVVAVVASTGSLYFSLGLGLIPCELCWYQRILMYPLVVVLGVATIERRPAVSRTALPLSVLGVGVAAYHSYLQVAPGGGTCSLGGGCTAIQWSALGGVLTIPRLSLLAFVLVSLGTVAAARLSSAAPR